jgi:protein-S-isoprenylcysteine O-methyltransferase Ste14
MKIALWMVLTGIFLVFLIVGRLLETRALFRTKVLQWAKHQKAIVSPEAKWVYVVALLLTIVVGAGEYWKAGNPVLSDVYTTGTYIGIALLLLGLNVLLNAMDARKQFFWFVQVLAPKEEIPPYSTNGIYAKLRNPRDWGMLLILAGLALALSLKFTLVFTVLLFFATVYKVSSRDRILLEKYGKEYINYMNKSKKLIPWIY